MRNKVDARCATCQYEYGHDKTGTVICGYLVFTGNRRVCSPEECDKYKPKTKRRLVDIDGMDHWVDKEER